ncbi:putative membrane protein [Salipiger aestuarii]|uniref:Putative membrane protein n=1 Tax=Salipiger aestuarii TaxID=568098 RepID=A0A327YD12_9RHOB|nr:DUF2254 domain-containing protein [Salipiger aestuarii]EIE51372.1 hypothetical protein C357_09249 [Citreicella sp. 357]RAK18347.1 putative membrane protein [Salipiger aestuarii]
MMLTKPLLLLRRVARNLVARVLFGAVLALAMAAFAPKILPLVPDNWQGRIKPDAVIPILNVLASTMLTVTTFSLSVMVSAFQAAASQATPRAYRLQLADTTTHTVLAVFTGAFLYSLTALVMYRAGFYAPETSVVILGVTILVIAAIVVAILRWIDHLSTLGSLDDTLSKVEQNAREPLARAMANPALGGLPLPEGARIPASAVAVPAPRGGYVQFVDMSKLDDLLGASGASLTLAVTPGVHVLKGRPLAWLLGKVDDPDALCACFTLGETRTNEEDARFGIVVLAEIAQRALSPGINDPGTAIDAIHRITRLLSECEGLRDVPPEFPRIEVPRLSAADLVEDGFAAIIRAGAEHPQVVGIAVDGLKQLESSGWAEMAPAVKAAQGYALRHARQHLVVSEDRDDLAGRL